MIMRRPNPTVELGEIITALQNSQSHSQNALIIEPTVLILFENHVNSACRKPIRHENHFPLRKVAGVNTLTPPHSARRVVVAVCRFFLTSQASSLSSFSDGKSLSTLDERDAVSLMK
jgi:hypothetical protein